jgi:hypothetical protein
MLPFNCPQCQKPLKPFAAFCTNCGFPVPRAPTTPPAGQSSNSPLGLILTVGCVMLVLIVAAAFCFRSTTVPTIEIPAQPALTMTRAQPAPPMMQPFFTTPEPQLTIKDNQGREITDTVLREKIKEEIEQKLNGN